MTIPASTLHSSEIESYSKYHSPIEDSSRQLNDYTNRVIESAVADANQHATCSNVRLIRAVSERLSRPLVSQLESHVLNNSEHYPQNRYRVDRSSFRGFFVLHVMDAVPIGRLGSLVRIGNVYTGTDKIGHFHTEGYRYFRKHYLEGKPLEEVLQWGDRTERSYFGGYATGIYSWGDLSANFNGMRFFADLVPGYEDPLNINHAPMIQCENNQWVIGRKFDWRDYIDHSFDEGINCNSFSRKGLLDKHLVNVGLLSRKHGIDVGCYPAPSQIEAIKNKYKEYYPYIFNLSLRNSTIDEIDNSRM